MGTLLHFLYDWTDGNVIVAAFSGVNESTFEHLKIFYWPFVFYTIYEWFKFGKNLCGFFSVKLKSLLLSLTFIVVFFYTYRGILGFNVDFLNIADFFIASAISRFYEMAANRCKCSKNCDKLSLIAIILIGVMFLVFTYFPPHIGLFADPKGFYGIPH